jgi:ketosteroid isomerase-like protein
MASQNVEVVQRIYDALTYGDFERAGATELMKQLFDPEVELRQLADIAGTSGEFHGYGGLLKARLELVEVIAGMGWRTDDHTEFGTGVVTTVTISGTGRESGAPMEITVGHLFELRDGRVVRWVVYRTPEEAREAAGL